jgi:hypothetical protein
MRCLVSIRDDRTEECINEMVSECLERRDTVVREPGSTEALACFLPERTFH